LNRKGNEGIPARIFFMSLVARVHLVINTFLDTILDWLSLLDSNIDQTKSNQYNSNKKVENLMNIQQELQELQKETIQHQSIVTEIQDLKQQIQIVNKSCVDTVKMLQQQSNLLEKLLFDAKTLVQSNDDNGVDCHELLCYAQRVSKHTLRLLEPPIPQEHIMRMSLLFKSQSTDTSVNVVEQEIMDTVVDVIEFNHVPETVQAMDSQLLDLDLF
jgi:hypothetical protein